MLNVRIKNAQEIEKCRASGKLAAETLLSVGPLIEPGVTTLDINDHVHKFILDHDAIPSPLNYKGFPKSVCTSINNVVCHGIPEKRKLAQGDIINVDVTVFFDGFHGDTSATFYVGKPSEEARHVTEVARRSLELGIEEVAPKKRLSDIGKAIQTYAHGQKCSVVQDFVGHGIGRKFHEHPQVPHFYKKSRRGDPRFSYGWVFTIEPMINLGTYQVEVMKDGWTVLTRDRKLSAQFEHTVLVTETGVEILTDRGDQVLRNSEDVVERYQ